MENGLLEAEAVLITTAARWINLVDKIPPSLLDCAPAPGEWSALQCLRHLLDVEADVFPLRLRAFLAGEDFPSFDPATQGHDYGERTPSELAAEFALQRAQNLATLERVGPMDLARTVRHAELGPVTLAQMLDEWAAHDLAHTVQAERAIMQPFIVGSGPWRHYFRDHDVTPVDAPPAGGLPRDV